MKKWILAVSISLVMACAAQASLIGISGSFVEGDTSFTYDGKELQDGWSIRTYEAASSTVDFDISILDSFLGFTSVSVYDDALDILDSVTIVAKGLDVPNDSFVYSVLFDNVAASAADNYLLLDTSARATGSHDPQVSYTPGHEIPFAGTVQFDGQSWQTTAIPEPATMGLLGLGALALGLRRKLRK